MKVPAKLTIAAIWMLLALPAGATPSPATHLKLRFVGFNRWHYFTLAEVWVQRGYNDVDPGAVSRYLIIHNWDGTVAGRERQRHRTSYYIRKYGISRRFRVRTLGPDQVQEREGIYYRRGGRGEQRLFTRQEVADWSLRYRQAFKELMYVDVSRRELLLDPGFCTIGQTIEADKLFMFRGRTLVAITTGSWDYDVCSFGFPVPVGI